MTTSRPKVLDIVSAYYSEKLAAHGDTPQGVDWNGEASQMLRFEQLGKVVSEIDSFSVNDLGCGYGALLEFFESKFSSFSYSGFDVSADMITAANKRKGKENDARFIVAAEPDVVSDYGIASGIFNVRLQFTDDEWSKYLLNTLDVLNLTSNKGFSFNCLTKYSDEEKMRDYLYYADPCFLFDHCKSKYSRQVALYHDYGLYEFTIVVRK